MKVKQTDTGGTEFWKFPHKAEYIQKNAQIYEKELSWYSCITITFIEGNFIKGILLNHKHGEQNKKQNIWFAENVTLYSLDFLSYVYRTEKLFCIVWRFGKQMIEINIIVSISGS